MRRRDFITLIGGAAAAWPLAAHAQQVGKVPTIGFLGTNASNSILWDCRFVGRLRELGWVEDRTVQIEYRWSEGRPDRAAEIAAEFVRLKADIIVTVGPAVATVKQATASIPIVFAVANDPVGGGLVASLARPGGNVTGLTLQSTDLVGKPPVAGRYKLGDVGNPKGRPKKKKTVGDIIQEALMTRIKIEENGRSRTVTAQEVIIRNLVHAAARRDIRAIHALFSLRDRYQDSNETTLDPTDLESEDRKIIEEHLAGLQASGPDIDTQAPGGETDQSTKKNRSADGKNNGTPDNSEGNTS